MCWFSRGKQSSFLVLAFKMTLFPLITIKYAPCLNTLLEHLESTGTPTNQIYINS